MRPKALIDELDLLRPIYKPTAAYGHFGRSEFSWENTDRAAEDGGRSPRLEVEVERDQRAREDEEEGVEARVRFVRLIG